MNKREFLKKTIVLSAASFIAAPAFSASLSGNRQVKNIATPGTLTGAGGFLQPPLGYAYDALEPVIDAATMELHYSKHHAGYTAKFNAALNDAGETSTDIKDIFSRVSALPASVRNNGGGYFNHNLYWKFMSPEGGGEPQGKLGDALTKQFGSFTAFKEKFAAAASSHFGSGWAWLLVNTDGQLQIASLPNQDNPLMDIAAVKGTPLLNIDVWEHAYYLNYQNRRADYITAWWKVVSWPFVEELYQSALKA